MTQALNFEIKSIDRISQEFVKRNILDFQQAVNFIKHLPYSRNKNKEDLVSLFTDNCGTCSTKHALLKQLAIENDFKGLKLIVGLFKMNTKNTPEISKTLEANNIEYIPEAHCYLKYNSLIIDCTKENSQPSDFVDDLIEEMEINPKQITEDKVTYHKNYLKNWLLENRQITFTLNEFWAIREQCIYELCANQ